MRAHGRQGALVERFHQFAAEAAPSSPLVAALSRAAAADPLALELLALARPDQQRANLLLAAVHDLLLAGVSHPLAAWYPSVGGDRPPDDGLGPALASMLRDHRDALAAHVADRATQTNEVGRAAALWPAVCVVADAWSRPVTLVELGTSAGLLLHLDRYRYAQGPPGTPGSPVEVVTTVDGRSLASPPSARVATRLGIDAHPLDAADPAHARWLQACVWPDDPSRLARLRAALAVAADHDDLDVRTGDLVAGVSDLLAAVPEDTVPVVLHSAALAYLDPPGRTEVAARLADVGARRDLAVVSFEARFHAPFGALEADHPDRRPDDEAFLVGATTWRDGVRDDRLLASAHPHGAWVRWLDAVPS